MKQIFNFLYQIHPWLPAIYMVLFAIGLLGPAVYCAVKKLPYSIGIIWRNAKRNDFFAKIVVSTYLTLAILTAICLIGSLLT